MTNNSIFTRVLALIVCFVMVIGTFTACFDGTDVNDGVGTGTTTDTNSSTTTNNGTMGDSAEKEPEEDPVDPNEIFSAFASIDETLIYGALASSVVIGDITSVGAIVPADVKIEDGAQTLSLSIKNVEENDESFADYEIAHSLDVHVAGIAADNTVPMIVNLGAVLEAGLDATSLKLYHTENGTAVLMTRVDSLNDFAIHNQYYYNAETGEVSIYVASFSVFTAVQTTASKWEEGTVADTSWYNENDTEFTLEDVADFLGFRDLVDGGITFEGKTVTLATDIDLDNKLFNPIGGGWAYNGGKTFNGTFDGGNHTIYNIRVNGWELDETGDKHSGTSMGAGLFSSLHNATIRNLAVVGADLVVETTSIGIIAGCAQGKCTFENIVVSDATLGNYQMRNGGIVGDIYVIADDNVPENEYSHTFTNIVVDSTVKLSSMWGDFDTGNGGVIGGKYGSAKVLMQNVIVAAELDVFSDVTAAYQWYAYRRCGMLVGYTGQNSPKKALNAAADFLTCENVSVYYGDWTNYTYYQFADQTDEQGNRLWNSNYPWVRAQESDYNGPFSNVRYGNPIVGGVKINTIELADANKTGFAAITFNQLYGGGQGVYGAADHNYNGGGVTIHNSLTKTVYINNNLDWTNLKLHYWFKNGDDTWTTVVEGIELTEENGVYRVNLPAYAFAFKIVDNGENTTRDFYVSEVAENVTYDLDFEHTTHYFNSNNKCDCGVTLKETEHQFTLGKDGEAKHSDGSSAFEYTETVGDYTLTFSNTSSVYHNARDEMGNSCIKLGTGSLTGGFSFTVPEDVVKVIVYVAGYKSNNATIEINGVQHEITTLSNNGEYTAIEVDTSETKTVSIITTTIDDERCMLNTISFVTIEIVNDHTCVFSEATCTKKATCEKCGTTKGELLPHIDNNPADHTCDVCGIENLSEHIYENGICTICSEKEPADYSGAYYIATNRVSGNYFYMTSDLGTASTKRYQAIDSGLTVLPESITNPQSGYVFIIERNDDGTYRIRVNGLDTDNYLGWTSNNSGILVAKESAKNFAIELSENGTYTISFDNRYLSLNGTSGYDYFAFYEGTQRQDLTLIPVIVCDHANTTENVVDPTCTEAGYTITACANCGAEIDRVAGDPATGHSYNSEVTTEAKCTTAGVTTYTCGTCSHSYTEEIAAIGHTTDNGICGNCGQTIGGTTPDPDPETPTETTASMDIFGATGTLASDKSNIQWTNEMFTVTNTKTSSSNAIRNSDSDHYRVYKGSTLTISVSNGTLTKVVITCTSGYVSGISTGATNAEYSVATDGTIVIITVSGENEITITASEQARITNVEVTYTTAGSGSEGGETPNPDPSCEHTNTTTNTVDATCTEAGSRTVTCDDCEVVISTEVIEATGEHTYEGGKCTGCGAEEGGSTEPTSIIKTLSILGSTGTKSSDSSSISWTSDDVTVTNKKGSTAIRTSDSDHYRVYANSTVTISANGSKITQVVITCTSSSYATVMKTSATNASYTATVDGSVVTITDINADSITFTASAQTRMNEVEVTYTEQ